MSDAAFHNRGDQRLAADLGIRLASDDVPLVAIGPRGYEVDYNGRPVEMRSHELDAICRLSELLGAHKMQAAIGAKLSALYHAETQITREFALKAATDAAWSVNAAEVVK